MKLWDIDTGTQEQLLQDFEQLYAALDANGWEPLPDNRIGLWNNGYVQVAVIALTDAPFLAAILRAGATDLRTVNKWALLRKLAGRLEAIRNAGGMQ